MKVLITGASGMIGSHLLKKSNEVGIKAIGIDIKESENVRICDLGNISEFEKIIVEEKVTKIIHLAALAHAVSGKNYTQELYEHLNVECAKNVFQVASRNNAEVLFISTVDVFGFTKGVVNANTECHPVTLYGDTKYRAEQILKKSGAKYTIYRFSPVYTMELKRDIQKRIYLKYPNWAYQIGKNTQYEVLNLDKAIDEMIRWCLTEAKNEIKIIKDNKLLNTKDYIREEKAIGKAKHVIKLPRWAVIIGYSILRITGKNKYTFLLNKAVNPLRSE